MNPDGRQGLTARRMPAKAAQFGHLLLRLFLIASVPVFAFFNVGIFFDIDPLMMAAQSFAPWILVPVFTFTVAQIRNSPRLAAFGTLDAMLLIVVWGFPSF